MALAALLLLALSACGGGGSTPPLAAPATSAATPAPAPTSSPPRPTGSVAAAQPTSVLTGLPAPAPPDPVTPQRATAPPTATTRPATVAAIPSPTRAPTPTPAPPAPTVAPRPVATPTVATVARARTIERGPTARRMIALTFDAGADRGFAAAILDTLRDADLRATFGMTGRWAEQNPDLVQRMVAEGHLLMNHTYAHASFTGRSPGTAPLSAEERRRAIERTETVIRALTGTELRPYFRPPYGDVDDALAGQLGALGYAYNVLWSVDSLGWDGLGAERIVARCLAGAAPGAILLFHVGADSQDAAALPELIRQLRAAGYRFGTIAELLQ